MNISNNRFESQLKNGIRVVLYYRLNTPITTDAVIHSGSKFDPEETPGFSHFLEHLIVSGSKKFPTKDLLAEHIESVGGFFGATTNQDFITIRTEIPYKNDYNRAVDIFEATLCKPLLDEKSFNNEKKVVIKEIKISQSNPNRVLVKVCRELFFKGNQFEHDVLGDSDSILNINYKETVSNHKKWFNKDRINFVVSGDILIEDLVKNLNKLDFIKNEEKLPNFKIINKDNNEKILNSFLDIPQTHLCFGFLAPLSYSKEMLHINILGDILANGRSSRLTKILRYKKGLIYSIHSNRLGGLEKGLFGFFTSTENEKVQEVVNEIIFEIKNIKENGILDSELEFIKNKKIKSLKRSMQTSNSWVDFHKDYEIFIKGLYTIENYIKDIEATTTKDIKKVIDDYFKEENWKLAMCGKTKKEDVKILF
jgi:predicted Zn-dependent peptidase